MDPESGSDGHEKIVSLLQTHPRLLLFDGVCNMCNGFVNFVLSKDTERLFSFASLQSNTGLLVLAHFNLPSDLSTVILVDNNQVYTQSSAILRLFSYLPLPWSSMYTFMIVPWFIRDTVYKCVANSRYSMFGKTDACRLLTPSERERFVDWGIAASLNSDHHD
eukprot:TRINITY_DN5944_c0_g1_i1.p1 TRINITY_DN5944_c0_g1~~TRINITY_DN5944_c0_g1_i1.p1  ORF type:complete len:187 (-),score=27.82 TRINITY_DN5944_c0_g1_i1:235-723(-)